MGQDEKTFEGQCYCGAVKIVVTGDPVGRRLLPLRRLQELVRGPGQRIHALEPRSGAGDPG